MLVIDQTVGEVETSPVSEAGAGTSEKLLTNNVPKVNSNSNNNTNKHNHVSTHEVDIKPKTAKPLVNTTGHSSNNVQITNSKDKLGNNTHAHSHHTGKNSKSAAVILTIGLTVHNILEGIAIGLSPSQEKLIMILIGICPHNLLESF